MESGCVQSKGRFYMNNRGMAIRKCLILGFLMGAGLGLFGFSLFGVGRMVFTQGSKNEETTISVAGANLQQEECRKIALTFDDGPHPQYTEQLLDGLAKRGVVVTFFVTGEHASLHPDTIARMAKEGHLIGNHTYSHMQLTAGKESEFKAELIKTNEVIQSITGTETLYVRPPYGTWDKSFEAELNMFPVLWTVDPLDWCSNDVTRIVDKVIKNTQENDIILLHDYYDTSVTAALEIVDALQQEGFTFVTVDEILFD